MGVLDNIFKRTAGASNDVKSETGEADIFDTLKYVDNLCNMSLSMHKSKLEEEKNLLKAVELLDQLNKYNGINQEDIEKIEELIDKYSSLGKEKESLKSDLLLNEKKFEDLRKYEDNIETTLGELRDMEDNKEKLDVDLKYLKAEQGALRFEEERIFSKYKLVENLFYMVLLVTCVCIITFSGLYFLLGDTIILPSTIIAIIIIFWIMWISMLEGDLKLSLEKNKFKQEKIVKMINKVKIKIVNAESDLITQYKKYDVNSAASLKNKWAIYKQTKNKRMQYNEIFTDYFDIYEKIEKILNKYNIRFESEMTVLKLLSDTRDKIRLREETENEIIACKKKIENYEKDQKEIIEKLKMLKDDDDEAVVKVVDSYLEQIENGNFE